MFNNCFVGFSLIPEKCIFLLYIWFYVCILWNFETTFLEDDCQWLLWSKYRGIEKEVIAFHSWDQNYWCGWPKKYKTALLTHQAMLDLYCIIQNLVMVESMVDFKQYMKIKFMLLPAVELPLIKECYIYYINIIYIIYAYFIDGYISYSSL